MVNAQDYINKKYGFSSKKKEAEEVLDIKEKSLEGHLDLSGFVNLKELDCSYNELDSLDVSECSNLTRLDLSYNSFDDIDFLLKLPNPEKLIYINIEESGVSLSEEEVKEKLSQFINLGGSSNALEEIKSISLEKQKFEDKVEALKKENHFLKSQLDEIQKKKSEFEKEILN
jgi:hypothetical protein